MSEKSTYHYKLFRVKRSDGRVTTVSMDPVLFTNAVKVMGGLKEVGRAVRVSASTYEEGMGKNCSGFVAQQLRESVQALARARRESKVAQAQAQALTA